MHLSGTLQLELVFNIIRLYALIFNFTHMDSDGHTTHTTLFINFSRHHISLLLACELSFHIRYAEL